MTAPSARAVFLSYAREDAEPARRVADALRGAGIEVWFDQSELRGGDAWDRLIREQIRDCALFLPIISAHTQQRKEGYFRREWKQAVDRLDDIAEGVPFLVPVCIDDTAEKSALVPRPFLQMQWTRLHDGAPSAAFIHRIQRLLADEPMGPARTIAMQPLPVAPPFSSQPRRLASLVAAVALVVAAGGLALWLARGKRDRDSAPPPLAGAATSSRAPASSRPAPTQAGADLAAKSIAVLPFESVGEQRDDAHFADGLHDEVHTAVGKISALRVIGRTSVLSYREAKTRNLKQIAADLEVGAVLEATVRRVGNRVKISAKLTDTRTGTHMWGDSYDGDLVDVFAVQSRIAQQVAAELKATLTAGERELLDRRPTRNAEAYRLYLEGVARHRKIGFPDIRANAVEDVIRIYERAVAADPSFPLPYVRLADLHTSMYWFGSLDPTPERERKAAAVVERLAKLAPDSPEAHLANGVFLYNCRSDWSGALAEYRQAELGLPNDPEPIAHQGYALRRLGRFAEASDALQRAVSLDPHDETAAKGMLETLIVRRRYAEAIARGQPLVSKMPVLAAALAAARMAMDGQVLQFAQTIESIDRAAWKGQGNLWRWIGATSRRDWVQAAAILTEAENGFGGFHHIVVNPAAHYRAQLAYWQGHGEDAKTFAREARRYFETQRWTPRQEPFVAAERALAHAIAGEARLARSALDQSEAALHARSDAYAAVLTRFLRGNALIVLGDTDGALAELRSVMAGPVNSDQIISPAMLRHDPFWSPLTADPRFEEILQLAKMH